jgi:acyl-coenzyme A synthetase/AMP-(fatty) acid ligase
LDCAGHPLPPEWPGELYIGGAGVADGYLHQPEQTAESFVANRFGGSESLLYRTGDLAIRHQDGNLVWLGRKDNQIKIRGYRVEPEEIERTLMSHTSVREAAVILDDGRLQQSRSPDALAKALIQYEGGKELLNDIESLSEIAIHDALRKRED